MLQALLAPRERGFTCIANAPSRIRQPDLTTWLSPLSTPTPAFVHLPISWRYRRFLPAQRRISITSGPAEATSSVVGRLTGQEPISSFRESGVARGSTLGRAPDSKAATGSTPRSRNDQTARFRFVGPLGYLHTFFFRRLQTWECLLLLSFILHPLYPRHIPCFPHVAEATFLPVTGPLPAALPCSLPIGLGALSPLPPRCDHIQE